MEAAVAVATRMKMEETEAAQHILAVDLIAGDDIKIEYNDNE